MPSHGNRSFGPGKSCSKTPQNDQKMHLEVILGLSRCALPVISLVFALKFWSKIDIFHRYLYSDFLKIFFKIRQKSNFLVKFHKKTTYLRYMLVFL